MADQISNERIELYGGSDMEVVCPGCTLEWIQDNTILVAHLSDVKTETVDAWANRNIEIRYNHNLSKPLYTLTITYDATFSPHLRKRLVDLNRLRQGLKTYSAVVIPQSVTAQFARAVIESLTRFFPNIRVRFFFNRVEALHWLHEMIAQEQLATV